MIFKFSLENSNDFSDCFSKMNKLGSFCVCDGCFYIEAPNNKRILSEIDVKEISEINKDNYTKLSNPLSRKWCGDRITKNILKEFEKTDVCKNRLIEINKLLDILEGGGKIGKEKEKNNSIGASNSDNRTNGE